MRLEIQCVLFVGGLPATPKTPHLWCTQICLPRKTTLARQILGWPDISPSASFLSFYYANFHVSPSPWRTWKIWKSLHVFSCWKKCLVNHWGNTWFQVIAGTLPNCSSSLTVRKLAIAPTSLDLMREVGSFFHVFHQQIKSLPRWIWWKLSSPSALHPSLRAQKSKWVYEL